MIPSIMAGSLIRATPPAARMSAGTRSRAMTATAPASSAILACSGVTTSMMTPPLSIWARPFLVAQVDVSTVICCVAPGLCARSVRLTSGSARRAGHVTAVAAAIGDRLAAVYDRTAPHVPENQVAEALALAEQHQVDAVIALGGGSPIGLAKATAQALEQRRGGGPARAAYPTDQPHVPVVAIPTTYAGSEMTAIYGATREIDGVARKTTVTDPKVAAKLVVYDPLLTLDLPPELTALTGINALAHCVEALYSVTRNPLSSAAALSGARAIARALPRCYANGRDVAARSEMLMGAHLAGASLASVTMALHHGICHVLGGTAGVPHGVANAIILPHAMRFNLDQRPRRSWRSSPR